MVLVVVCVRGLDVGRGVSITIDIVTESDRVYATIPVRSFGQFGQADRFLIIAPISVLSVAV